MTEIEKLRDEPQERILAFARVMRVVTENEGDGDHVQEMFIDYGDLMKWYGEVVWPDNKKVTESDVEKALEIARDYCDKTLHTSISIEVGRNLPDVENDHLLRI